MDLSILYPMTKQYKNHISTAPISPIPRIGFGYDVHAFTDGDHIILCGVKIPHTRGFLAHSDGDVALHAITDALYGAIAHGDIGQHFPPNDEKFKNMNSRLFLQHAGDCIANKDGKIGNIDITIVTETPKIAPHCATMRQNVADIVKIPLHAVSIKATTSEKMGFIGRGDGIAVHAVACVFTPNI